jgi:hypothetical protein
MNYLLMLPLVCLAQTALAQEELPGLIMRSKMENSCQLIDETTGSPANGAMIDISLGPNRKNIANSAIVFNQNTSYISLGTVSKLKLTGDESISFWIKPTVTGTDRTGSIFSYGTGMVIGYQEQSSVPKLTVSFGNTLYLQTSLTTEWQAVTITFAKDYSVSKSKAALYIDGIFKAESEQNKSTQSFTNALALIGPVNAITPVNGFRGSLDDFSMYNRTLTATEILNAALPVKLESFTAKRINGAVHVNWKTTVEENVSHFDVQRSIDGIIFQTIKKITAGTFNYQFIDVNALIDTDSWYRLQIVNKDGKTEYSSVIKVLRDTAVMQSEITMFPNPAGATINFRGDIENHTIKIVSITGAIARNQSLTHKINIADIKPGLYYVVIYDDMGYKKLVSKFIKRND